MAPSRSATSSPPVRVVNANPFVDCVRTIYLDRAADRLRGRGEGVPEHLLPHVSPLARGHIALTGDYLWDSAAVDPLGFRPLNEPPGYLGAAA